MEDRRRPHFIYFYQMDSNYKHISIHSSLSTPHPPFFTLHPSTFSLIVEVGVWHGREPSCWLLYLFTATEHAQLQWRSCSWIVRSVAILKCSKQTLRIRKAFREDLSPQDKQTKNREYYVLRMEQKLSPITINSYPFWYSWYWNIYFLGMEAKSLAIYTLYIFQEWWLWMPCLYVQFIFITVFLLFCQCL